MGTPPNKSAVSQALRAITEIRDRQLRELVPGACRFTLYDRKLDICAKCGKSRKEHIT